MRKRRTHIFARVTVQERNLVARAARLSGVGSQAAFTRMATLTAAAAVIVEQSAEQATKDGGQNA